MSIFKKLLKIIGFFIVIVPFGAVSCQSKTTQVRSPKYILSSSSSVTSGNFIYYSINGDTEYAVALKESAKSSSSPITILGEYNNKPVTGIWRYGFSNSKATSISIPDGITVIDYEAFMGSSITAVTIPYSVEQIGESAFYSCHQLEKAVFHNTNGSTSGSSACACIDDEVGEPAEVIPSTLTTIPSFCFFNCKSLKELVLPQSIEEIGYEAFNGCKALFSTLAFMNIKTIHSRAFQNCTALRKVYISESFFEKEAGVPVGVLEEHAFNKCSSSLMFYLVGDADDISDWITLQTSSGNRWLWRDETENPATSVFSYTQTAGGASYSNDWIYTIDQNNDVEISSYIGPTEIEGDPVEFISIPEELPSGSGKKVRTIATNALDTVKASIKRLYLPKTLRRIGNDFFTSSYTNLSVIDDVLSCSADSETVAAHDDPTPRIKLNNITDLQYIGKNAFVNLPKLAIMKKLYLPYSLIAIGSHAFGSSGDNNKHMKAVTDFRWDYDDEKSALEVIGNEAFYKLGKNDSNKNLTGGGVHQGYLSKTGTENYQLTTLIIPRTFKHFGMTASDLTAYGLGDAADTGFDYTFAACPLLSKVIFRGSKSSKVRTATTDTTDSDTANLVLGPNTFAMNESLRTIVFEERLKKIIVFSTGGGNYKPTIGWSSGKAKNDFGGDPALQTLVLPNKYTNLYFQNYALQGNSRGVIYLSAGTGNKINGSTQSDYTKLTQASPNVGSKGINDSSVKEWRTIGDEGFYNNVCPGYCFSSSVNGTQSAEQNYFGIDQKMPMYGNVLYKETVNAPGISNVEVEVGYGNTNEYVVKNKCAFICDSSNKARLTNYLYDRYDSSFTGTARVPATAEKASGTSCTVNKIGASAFSAAYCDTTSYKNDTLHKDLTAVEIPSTITDIEEYAFMRAFGVTKVSAYNVSTGDLLGDYVMPSSLSTIGKHAFAFCNIVKFLNIPIGCRFYENLNATTKETSVFSNNFSLRKITFGSNATSSTYYETTTYTSNGGETYTSAIYSKNNVAQNASALLLVLNRDSADYHAANAADLIDDLVEIEPDVFVHYYTFNGQYADNFLYGAFKMCYWIDALTVGTPFPAVASLEQPLISGIYDSSTNKSRLIYLNNNENCDFTAYACNLKTIDFGTAGISDTPPYSFEGCEQLEKIRLPYDDGGSIPAGLFSYIGDDVIFEVPNSTHTGYVECAQGVVDLTYTGYSSIEAEAFKNTGITKIIAPITDEFTIEHDALSGCGSLTEVDFSNVTDNVVMNACFRGANGTKITDDFFTWSSTATVEFGAETFKDCTFEDNYFSFPAKTSIIGDSCFENCSTLHTVTADAVLADLKPVVVDNGEHQNNAGNNTGFKQIGDFAFHMCTNLTDFDFSKFTYLERIGHYAFSMNSDLTNSEDKTKGNTTATICPGGVLDLPASLTNLGVGAFNYSAITSVKINSSEMKFERGKGPTNNWNYTSNPRITAYGGHQFRHCKLLTEVIFTDPDCLWTTEYVVKGSNNSGQDNFFSVCASLTVLVLPKDYDIQHWTNSSNATARPDSMIWCSNDNIKIYLHHTTSMLTGDKFVSIFWRRTKSVNQGVDVVYFVGDNSDVVTDSSGSWQFYQTGQKYWTYKNGAVYYLGTATVNSSTGLVTFQFGDTADANGVNFAS